MSPLPGYFTLAAVSLSLGYFAGKAASSSAAAPAPQTSLQSVEKPSQNPPNAVEAGSDSEDSEDEEHDDTGLESLKVDSGDECKLALVVRTDLGMTTGKIAAQCSHATLACYKALLSSNPALLKQWERNGQTKVTLRCADEDELLLLQAQAQSLRLCARTIQDAGRTQIASGSRTVLGIAGPVRLVNQVTGALRLL